MATKMKPGALVLARRWAEALIHETEVYEELVRVRDDEVDKYISRYDALRLTAQTGWRV